MKPEIESAVFDLATGKRQLASHPQSGKLPASLDELVALYQQLKGVAALPVVDVVENQENKCLLICNRAEGLLYITKVDLQRLEPVFAGAFDFFQFDPLTQALRKEYALPHVAAALTDFLRYETPFALLFADIDHFKAVNDTHGHLVGDEVLKGVAQQIRSQLRQGDDLIRYGGEEFLVILKHAPLAHAFKVAERLRAHLAATPIATRKGALGCTISIGITSPQRDDTPLALIERADRALYQAKARGRNRVEFL